MYPSLRDLPDRMSRAEARTVIVNGRRAMPSFSGLTDAEQNALLDYLFTPPEDD